MDPTGTAFLSPAAQLAAVPSKSLLEACIGVIASALGMVMAGTCETATMRIMLELRNCVSFHVWYGHQAMLNTALGWVGLGGGRMSFGRSPLAIASLFVATYPRIPTGSNDNSMQLQALRHLHVLAAENRYLDVCDATNGKTCSVPLVIELARDRPRLDGPDSGPEFIHTMSPCLLPEVNRIVSIRIVGDRFENYKLDLTNVRQRAVFLATAKTKLRDAGLPSAAPRSHDGLETGTRPLEESLSRLHAGYSMWCQRVGGKLDYYEDPDGNQARRQESSYDMFQSGITRAGAGIEAMQSSLRSTTSGGQHLHLLTQLLLGGHESGRVGDRERLQYPETASALIGLQLDDYDDLETSAAPHAVSVSNTSRVWGPQYSVQRLVPLLTTWCDNIGQHGLLPAALAACSAVADLLHDRQTCAIAAHQVTALLRFADALGVTSEDTLIPLPLPECTRAMLQGTVDKLTFRSQAKREANSQVGVESYLQHVYDAVRSSTTTLHFDLAERKSLASSRSLAGLAAAGGEVLPFGKRWLTRTLNQEDLTSALLDYGLTTGTLLSRLMSEW